PQRAGQYACKSPAGVRGRVSWLIASLILAPTIQLLWTALHESFISPFEDSLKSGHPKTGVPLCSEVPLVSNDRIAFRPTLSPEWPRAAVIPPLNTRRPSAS